MNHSTRSTMVICITAAALLWLTSLKAAPASDATADTRDREMRDRYEKVLLKNPFQERAFNQLYDGYSKVEGVDKWIEVLKPKVEGEDGLAVLLLLGQLYDRQFKSAEAIAALEKAAQKGESRPQFKILLGTLYYKTGQDEKAAELLNAALDSLTDLDQRSLVCRMLGNLYLRQGKRDQAITVWKRISEQNPQEIFAQLELAEIYEDNRMWDQAIQVYRQVISLSKEDPYRRCRALRSIGQCLVHAEKFKDAIATYEEALGLVSPGNWLFEDLKLRLVGVYEDIGDLAGLVKYVTAKLEQNEGDMEFRELLAETYTRMARFEDAEKQFRTILERNPRNSSTYEKLIGLYTRMAKKTEVAAAFDKLIELFPTDTEYLRRLGEFYLRDSNPEKAKETWRRLTKDAPAADKTAQLAGWFESYDFPDEAIAAYQQALEKGKNKDWVLRLAALKFQKGEEADAIKLWLSAIDPATSKVEDYAEVASVLEANQKIDEAGKLRKAAVEKDATNLESHLAYAKILMRQQKYDEAVAEFELLSAQDKNEFMTQQGESGRLDAWRELGVLEEKQKEWERELQKNPSDAKRLSQLVHLYERAGQREKAIALYEGRREQEPDNVEHLRALAGLYKNAKQTEQAIATFKALLEKDRNRARVYQKELLDIYLAVDLKGEAIAAGEQIVSLAPSDPEARLTLAQVYQLYRQPDKGLNEYRSALRLEPNEPDYYRQYGEALEAEKRYGEAQEAFRKMLDVAKEDTTRLSAVANLARIYLLQDQLDSLVGEFNRRIRNTPKKLASYEELAAIYKESGQIFKSVEVLESGLQNVDDKSTALKALIRTGYEAQDFPKVKSYFEQLVGLSAKPTANEFEKLGQIYAQLGDVEKAKATWNNILTAAPKDPKAYDRVAKLLQEQGFTDEALVVKAKAVEFDPADYKRRFDYAQWLAQSQQPIQAMDQIRQLLELGDREEKKDEKESEKKVQRVSKGQQSNVNPYQFMYGGGRFYGRYWGGGWQGTFKQFRLSVLQFMASLAQQSIGEEAFIEQMQERAKKAGVNIEFKRDLLTILQMFNRVDEGLKLGEEILAAAPNDPELLQTIALLYSNQQQLDKAIPLLERLAQTQPKQRLAAASGLVPLYFKNKEEEKALALVEDILKENPTDLQTYYAMSSMLQNNGKYDSARRVLEKLREVDPQQADQVRNQLANLAKQSGKLDEALALNREMLFSEPQRPSYFGRSKRVEIYAPEMDPNRGRPNFGNPLQNLPPNAFGGFDWQKGAALGELKMAAKSGTDKNPTNVFEAMYQMASGWSLSATPNQRDRSWEMARLLAAHYIGEKDFDKASEVLAAVRKAGFEEAGWFNAAIYLAQQKEDFSGMVKLYDELQQRYPAKARDIVLARTYTHLLAKNYEEAGKVIRNLNEQRVPPTQILGLIGVLQRAGEKKLAKQLLEEHLSGVSRNPQALSMLASLYGEDSDFDKAIALANEAWERKAHGTQGGNPYYVGYYGYMPQFSQVDSLLNELHRYYVGAGKSDELIARFTQALEKQPGSVKAYENLASLYRSSDQRDKALELYQQLAQKRPHLLQVNRTIAGLYQEMGQFDKATKVYEDLIKANPNLYQSFQWELRWAYQRQGKGKELQKMEDNIAAKARDPNQLMQLAYRMKEDGELDKAIDLFRKAVKMAPGQTHLQGQLASALMEKGQLDEALKAYEEWFKSPQLRGQGWMDHSALRQFAGLYKANGKLDDLKDRCEADLKKNSGDRTARALQAHIAFLEKRYDDALAAFKSMLETGNDPNVISQLIELAGFSGKFKEVLAVAEKADAGGNSWDSQQLASLYLAAGDKKKAAAQQLKWAEQMIQQGNGNWALRQTMDQLAQMDLWDEAEQFVSKHRTDNMDQWEAEEFDRTLAMRYVNEGRFEATIKPLLAKDSLKGRDLSLVQKIAEQYQSSNQPAKRREFLEKLVAADPKNRDLAFNLAQLYDRPQDLPKKIALLQPLLEADTNKPDYRRVFAETLIDLGRTEEALASLTAWVNEKPGEQRWLLLSQMQARAGRARESRESLARAVDVADKVRKTELQIQLASFDTQHGEASAEKAALQTNFMTKKDAQSFQRYWRFLEDKGYAEEAYTLFVTNKDNGYFEQYQQNDFVALCLNYSDYSSAADLNWRFTRYGNRWERDMFLDRVAKVYRERGKMSWFVEDFSKRVEQDAGANQSLRERVARSWEQAGYPEKALVIYERQLKDNPFNRNAIQNKVNHLIKLGRIDEAVALLRDPKGISGLDVESAAKISLIEMLFRLERKAEAEKEITDLLAWDKRPNTLMRIGNLLMDEKQSAQASELLEKATGSVRDWNYDELLLSLAKCRAKLGQADDLAKLTEELMRSGNADWRLQALQGWLSAEGFYDLLAKLLQTRLARSPEKLELYAALAAARQDAGRTAEALAAYEAAAKALPESRAGEIRSSFAGFLIERNLIAAALRQLETGQHALLVDALIEAFARSGEKSDSAKILAAAAVKFESDNPELQIRLGDAFANSRRTQEAGSWYRRALSSTNELQRVAAASGLAHTTGDKAAAPVLAELLKTKPHWFITREEPVMMPMPMPGPIYYGYGIGMPATFSGTMVQPPLQGEALLVAAAKTGDAALISQLQGVIAAAAVHDSERDYYSALISYHRGQTNETRAQLSALADAPKVTVMQLQTLAKLFEEQGMNPERVKALQRITKGGYPSQARWRAFGELVKAQAKAGDLKQAIATLAQMQGVWGSDFSEDARAALAEAVRTDNFAAFKSGVLETVRARPQDDVVSNLLGFCQQIAQRLGVKESAASLATEAQVADAERREAAAWDDLIEQWEIAGPFRAQGPDLGSVPNFDPNAPAANLPKLPEPTIPESTTWRKTDPQRELGIIRLAPALGLDAAGSTGQSAYARTTITSPDERRVILCLGSDDWVRVWVNGAFVHGYSEPRFCTLDQDRFAVTLKKGMNKILLKVGNNSEAWSFCLRIAEGRESLTWAQN